MSKIDEFKEFVRSKPELASSVINNETTWQKLYETYDMYGKDSEIWKNFVKSETRKDPESSLNIKNILNSLGNIDTESFQSNINSIQKAIGFFEELTKSTKKDDKEKKVKKAQSYKTFDKFYSD